jgi:DNA-binding MarR family transcriptional regulator
MPSSARSLERGCAAGADSGADIAIRPDQYPVARRQAAGVAEVAAIVHQVAAPADEMGAQSGSRHITVVLGRLREALIDVVGFFNRTQNDAILLHEAGLSLPRALFPLLVLIERRGSLGVGELADKVGREVAKLERLGFVARQMGKTDRRMTETVVTGAGRAISEMLDAARQRLAETALAGWSEHDLAELARLLRRLADTLINRAGYPTATDARDEA